MEKPTKRKMLQDYLNSIEDLKQKQIIIDVLSIEKQSIPKAEVVRAIKKIIEKKHYEDQKSNTSEL